MKNRNSIFYPVIALILSQTTHIQTCLAQTAPSPTPPPFQWLTTPAHLTWDSPETKCLEDIDDADEDVVPNQPQIVDSVYEASKAYDMPPNVLYGALRQESSLIDYGIIYDLGNYSCGMAQINISEWCQYVHTLSKEKQNELGWPASITDCDNKVKPKWLGKVYRALNPQLFQNTSAATIGDTDEDSSSFFSSTPTPTPKPTATPNAEEADDFGTNTLKFTQYIQTHRTHSAKEQAVLSFVNHCGHFQYAIPAKAEILRNIFDTSVPAVFKNTEVYKNNEGPKKWSCKVPYPSTFYPFHTGWLIADGIYNLGDELVDMVVDKVKKDYSKLKNPVDLLYAIKEAGVLSPKTEMLNYQAIDSKKTKATSWFRTCIVDRHLTNVVNFTLQNEFKQTELIISDPCENFIVPDNARTGYAPMSRVELEKARNPHYRIRRLRTPKPTQQAQVNPS